LCLLKVDNDFHYQFIIKLLDFQMFLIDVVCKIVHRFYWNGWL